jgi:integrase
MENTLRDYATTYLMGKDVCHDYQMSLLATVKSMAAAGLVSLTDVTPEKFNLWISSLTVSKVTKSNYRRMALTILRHAMPNGFADFSSRCSRVKPIRKIPVAWSQEELMRLITTASKMDGVFSRSRCPASLYFTAWILVAYETGLRYGDQQSLTADQLRGDRLFVVQSKTGQPVGKRLSLQCLELVNQMIDRSPDGTVFKWAINERNSRNWWPKLIKSAGLKGSPKYLRRSGATYVEATQPGAATVFLGHRSAELAERNYIDPTLLPDRCPKPPPLFPLSRSKEDFPSRDFLEAS